MARKLTAKQAFAEYEGVVSKIAVVRGQRLMFAHHEFTILRSQIVTSSWGGTRYLPYAFSEQRKIGFV